MTLFVQPRLRLFPPHPGNLIKIMSTSQIALRKKTRSAKVLAFASLPQPAGTTLQRLVGLIKAYTHIRPVQTGYAVGSLVPNLDYLGADINDHWGLKGNRAFWSGEIEATWQVTYLAGYIDAKIATK